MTEFSSGRGATTRIGYVNRNGQECHGTRGVPGTDHCQSSYQMFCKAEDCGHVYGANGSDVHLRKCPRCQGGRPGIKF